ncbi:MAG: MBL fold metallo-hydrolase [Acidobacteriaceae bacterium]|nr:MBL fold metallo-hydrolase [Acidobacteriaceae bacterium]
MCDVSRRNVLLGAAALGASFSTRGGITTALAQSGPGTPGDEINKAVRMADDVYFHQGDIEHHGYCNNGWIFFADYVLVIDANFPSGAQNILPKIRALTPKPVRFAFDTHHHGDHAYGNQVMVDGGATPVAHTGVIEEMKRYETGYYDSKPGRWEEEAKSRLDVAASRLKPPSVLFPRELYFDDGKHRVELLHLGIAHTHGDAVAWLPNERILFTGDACVNGPYNYVGDGDVEKWVATLDAIKKLGAQTICPGHGPRGLAGVLNDQQVFFKQLRERVGALLQSHKSAREIYDSVSQIREELSAQPQIARYVDKEGLSAQVEKVYNEMTGQNFPSDVKTSHAARLSHRHSHGFRAV